VTNDWLVLIPTGRWMSGVHHFPTLKQAASFMARWNQVEEDGGRDAVIFIRRSGTRTFADN
jgi:hypothetical protein